MLAFEEAVVRNENFEVVIVIVSQSLRAGKIFADILVRHTKVGGVIEEKKAGLGRMGESRKVVRVQGAEAFQ